jgi:HPt (histidine-containing phosphotransfer) domain-containing protein
MDHHLTKPLEIEAVQRALEQTVSIGPGSSDPLPSEDDLPAGDAPPPEETPSTPEVPPPAPDPGPAAGFDWARIDELREFDTPDGALVRETVAAFARQVPGRLAELRDSAARGDASRLREEAHALKGSATNIGAAAVGQWASRLEEAGRAGDLGGVESLLEELKTALVVALAALSAGPGEPPTPGGV